MELFNTSKFSSKNDAARDFEAENLSSKKKRSMRSHPKTDKAWDDGSAFPSSKNWKVGDRVKIKREAKLPGKKCYLRCYSGEIQEIVGDRIEVLIDNSPNFEPELISLSPSCFELETNETDRWNPADFGENPPFKAEGEQLTIFYDDSLEPPNPDDFKSITEYNEAWKQWELHNSTSVQESVLDSVTPACSSDLSLSELQKPMTTAQTSFQNDIRECIITETCDRLPLREDTGYETEKSTLLQPPPPANHSASRESETAQTTNATASPPYCESSTITNQSLQQSKIPPDCSIVPIVPEIHTCTVTTLQSNSQNPDTVSRGLSFQVFTLAPPLIEKDYCLLPTPTALSTMSSRPPGQTKLENFLKENSLIKRNEVLDPAILCQWYQIPETWLDPSESRVATELLESSEQQQEIFSIPELQQLHSVESFISTKSHINLLSTQEVIEALSISEDELDEFWNNEPAFLKGFEIQWLGATIQKWKVEPNTLLKDRLPQSESIPENFLEDKKQLSSIEPLSLSPVKSNTTPKNFLEESTADTKQLPSRKRRQRKGCLYKYLENKKLKNGNIASYPRVIGETRDPDNPKHWRWGFNWEEKIDGEWKGRSIGSVPIGAIALIQSMQKEGVPLEEIIGFIRRSKNKA